jgi:Na+/glutamate symporter
MDLLLTIILVRWVVQNVSLFGDSCFPSSVVGVSIRLYLGVVFHDAAVI